MKKIASILFIFLFLFVGISQVSAHTIEEIEETFQESYMPSTGNVKALVIPINFEDVTSTVNVERLDSVYLNGPSLEPSVTQAVDTYSVRQYYYTSSYQKLNLSFNIANPYTPEKESFYYAAKSDYIGCQTLLHEYLEQAATSSLLNLSEYDSDNDGYVDCVYLIYNHTFDQQNDNLWWAFTTDYTVYRQTTETKIKKIIWMSYDFFLVKDPSICVHETGHALGLEDYYDYDHSKGLPGGLGCDDMMDSNFGDHNSFSKSVLGWIDETKITTITLDTYLNNVNSYTLKNFSTTGEVLKIQLQENSDEYFLVEYLDPKLGLNSYMRSRENGYSTPGVRILHIHEELRQESNNSSSSEYISVYKYNNTNTNIKLIDLVRASVAFQDSVTMPDDYKANSKDLFVNTTVNYTINKSFSFGSFLEIPCSLTITNDLLLNQANVKVTGLNSRTLEGAPKIEQTKNIELKRRENIKIKDCFKITSSEGKDITSDATILGYYDDTKQGSYRLGIKATDSKTNLTSYYYFDVTVTPGISNPILIYTLIGSAICVGLCALVCIPRIVKNKQTN